MSRRGLTLIEVTVGLVVTGVVALLAYGAVATASDTQLSLSAEGARAQGRVAWQALVRDVVRNVRASEEYGGPTLLLQDGARGGGRPGDRLALVSGAQTPPLGEGADWRVAFTVTDEGAIGRATPLSRPGTPRVVRGPREIVGMEVQALSYRGWVDTWTDSMSLPAALRITFWTEEGPEPTPLLLALPVGSGS